MGCKDVFGSEVALMSQQLEEELETGRRDKEERRKQTKKVMPPGVCAGGGASDCYRLLEVFASTFVVWYSRESRDMFACDHGCRVETQGGCCLA